MRGRVGVAAELRLTAPARLPPGGAHVQLGAGGAGEAGVRGGRWSGGAGGQVGQVVKVGQG